jgi:hypothetical protein
VKRSGRDEPIWIVIYMCMEAMLGICLYSYLYLKISFLSSFQQNWRKDQNRFCLELRGIGEKERAGGRGERWPKQYTHI